MAEFHEEMIGRTKSQNYRDALDRVNHEYNQKIKSKSFFTSSSSIESERQSELKKVEENFYGRNNRYGGMIEWKNKKILSDLFLYLKCWKIIYLLHLIA